MRSKRAVTIATAAVFVLLEAGSCKRLHLRSPVTTSVQQPQPTQAARPCSGTPLLCAGHQPLTTPFRERYPSLSNRYRLRGVHYFQGRWPYTFWDALRVTQLDSDFREISSYGFNTIILFLGWGNFQSTIYPPTYNEANFKKLDAVIEAARRNGLWVVLRVATPENVPRDVPGYGPFNIPDLMFAPKQIDAIAELFMTVSKRVAKYDNVYGLFNSWEDFSQYLSLITYDRKTRLDFENRRGIFRAYLRSHGSLESWNQRWGTSYARFEDIPLPAAGEPALADYVDMIAEYVNQAILAKIHVDNNVGLGYELRLDKEMIKVGDQITWHGYETGYKLPPQFTFIAAYYNPFWGAPNDGGFITPDFAAMMSQRVLHDITSNSNGLPVFFEQINLADDTPRYTRSNSKLRYPGDEATAVRKILPVLLRRTVGYGLWTHRDYVANMLFDSAFIAESSAWKATPALTLTTRDDGEKEAVFVPGQKVEQTTPEHFNPGKVSDVAYRFDITASLPTTQTNPATIELSITSPQGKQASKTIAIEPGPSRRYTVTLPELGTTTTELHVTIAASQQNRSPIHVAEVRLWNHLMATGVVDVEGRPRRSRVIAYQSENDAWNCIEAGQAVPASYATAPTSDACVDCTGIFEDGWAGQNTMLPLYLPFVTSPVTLEAYVPSSMNGTSGLQVEVRWLDAPRGTKPVVQTLKPGTNVIAIPNPPGSMTGDRTLVVRTNKTFRAPGDLRDLGYRLVRYGDVSLKQLPLGAPADGEFVTAIPAPDGNRLLVYGHADAASTFAVSVEPRGHIAQEFAVQPGDFHLVVPLWSERLSGRPEVFIHIRRTSGSGHLRITSLTGENERTPNDIYR